MIESLTIIKGVACKGPPSALVSSLCKGKVDGFIRLQQGARQPGTRDLCCNRQTISWRVLEAQASMGRRNARKGVGGLPETA
jgi:hypothetical protein